MKLPRAIDWRGKKLDGATRRQQRAFYGKTFKSGFPSGLCLHWPAHSTWSRYRWLGGDFINGVDQKMKESIVYARNSRNTYLLIDVLGRTHQDMDLDDRGIHGHSANAYTIGVEISSAGKLVKVGSDFFQAFNVRQGKVVNSSRPPFPGWAMNKGFSLFTPAQVEGLVKLVADLKYCDKKNVMGIEHKLGVSGITSHDFHSRSKTDVGHSLFTDVPRFSSLLCDYLACFPDYSDLAEKFVLLDEEIHAYAFKKVFLNDEEYKRVYCSWDYDAIPYWA